jgi:pSer/pThr/pTyr-binding forkhead associated (FHA) protein
MWGLLQMNCLLYPQQAAGKEVEPAPRSRPAKDEPLTSGPAARPVERAPVRPASVSIPKEADRAEERGAPSGYYLVLQRGRHRIALPRDGEIILGRFDPLVKAAPDVDLSFENRKGGAVSRRHVRIAARRGAHQVEDIGSTDGTMVNWRKLRIGQKVSLQPGDRVILGHCEFVYEYLPELQLPSLTVPRAYLQTTSTGQRFTLPSRGEVVIGRGDRTVGLNPGIDLSQEGNAAQYVARRHVRIVVRNKQYFAEDLGSASGTKLNGVRLRIGELEILHPGYHLWLGGCVLAYDIAGLG